MTSTSSSAQRYGLWARAALDGFKERTSTTTNERIVVHRKYSTQDIEVRTVSEWCSLVHCDDIDLGSEDLDIDA